MAKEKKSFGFAPLTSVPNTTQEAVKKESQYIDNEKETKITISVVESLQEKIKDYGYWEGLTQQDIILDAINEYFKDKNPKPRPDKIKNKKKVGRKKKN